MHISSDFHLVKQQADSFWTRNLVVTFREKSSDNVGLQQGQGSVHRLEGHPVQQELHVEVGLGRILGGKLVPVSSGSEKHLQR